MAAAATLATAGALALPALAGTTSVSVKDNFFSKTSLTVRKGTTVRWVWRGHAPHNVTVTRGPVKFHSANKVRGSYSKKLTRAGTYTLVCTIHSGMRMKLRVR
jgi:plastocyanin